MTILKKTKLQKSQKSSNLKNKYMTRYLNNFRRKPAMSKFDWHFTAIRKSTQYFATYTRPILQ